MLTMDLARLVAETPSSDISDDMRIAATAALIDTLGCGLSGANSDVAAIARATCGVATGQGAVVWGLAGRLPPAQAAFVNATAGHAMDYDDSLPIMRGHPSVPLFAAGLAVAGARVVSGRHLLDAYILGVELAGRLGRLLGDPHYVRGWHSTATIGTFTAAAITGRLMGMGASGMARALGLAAADSAGLLRNFGSMAKSLQVGRAARAGYAAADLAMRGATAGADALDGPGGFIETYGGAPVDLPTTGWAILDPGIYVKRWPCCYGNHRALAGILDLVRTHDIQPEDISRIRVGFMPDADKALVHTAPQTGLEAKFSIEYCAAAMVIDRRIVLASFDDAAIARPDVRRLMARVERFAMPGKGSFSGVHGETEVEIITASSRFATRVTATPGSPAAPMTAADRRDKFEGCVAPLLGSTATGRLFDALTRIDEVDDIDAVLALTIPAVPA